MILVNISAVGTSITFTLQPVSCSHFGPEKFFGSSDCSPASQTMVMVLPAQIFLAASTARCAAFWAAAVFAAPASGLLEPYVGIPTLRVVFAFVGVMILTLLVAGAVNYAIGRLAVKTGLSGTDRLLGAVFGVVRGVAIVVILVLVGGLTALPAEPWWQQARTLGPLTTAARAVVAWLPPDLAKHFVFGPG